MKDGKPQYQGKLGAGLPLEDGQAAARLCAINIVAQVKAACGGDLDRVQRVVKLTGFVNSTGDFTDPPKVVNGASDLMAEVFGDKGKHSRAAVSAPGLPAGVAVEVEAVVRISCPHKAPCGQPSSQSARKSAGSGNGVAVRGDHR